VPDNYETNGGVSRRGKAVDTYSVKSYGDLLLKYVLAGLHEEIKIPLTSFCPEQIIHEKAVAIATFPNT
jgi:hypothetical protein